jgi:DNA/RNA-binding protein KIN17
MNSTKWTSLTEFVKWMGREGICKGRRDGEGWFIKLVREEDPMERKKREREEAEKESDERHLKALRAQAAKAKKAREENGGGRRG